MIRSMTGFGRGEAVVEGQRFRVEIKSVNHRYLNANVRLPRELARFESRVVARCGERVERGHLDVAIEVEAADETAEGQGPRLVRPTLDRFLELIDSLEGLWNVRGGVSVETLLGLPGVIDWEGEPLDLDDETIWSGLGRAIDAAIEEVVDSREIEGRSLESDFRERLDTIAHLRERLAERAPDREAEARQRLREKVGDLLETSMEDELDRRIEQEIVLLADRIDVSEELSRMGAHLDHFAEELDGEAESVGRKLTFILQELHREANTIASKANDPRMQQDAIEIKSELEKMREQAENVE